MKRVLILNYTDNPEKHRLLIIRHFLHQNGFNVAVLTCDIWRDEIFRLNLAKKPWHLLGLSQAYLRYLLQVVKAIHHHHFDFILLGYPALFDFLFLRLFFPGLQNRLFVDYFLSFYDTIVLDRQLYRPATPTAQLIYHVERIVLRLAPHIITDTNTNAGRYRRLFRLTRPQWHRILVGSRLLFVHPAQTSYSAQSYQLKIGWVGAFIPLHGISVILEAAEKLKNEPFEFILIGDGQDFQKATELKKQNRLKRLILTGRLPYMTAMEMLKTCDICLGIFGKSAKAVSVIPIKIFDYWHLGKWIITQKSAAIAELPLYPKLIQIEADADALCHAIRQIALSSRISLNNSSSQLISDLISNDIQSTFKV